MIQPNAAPQVYGALNAARAGFKVLPRCPTTNAPLVPIEQATADPDEITKLWEQHPTATVGLVPKPPAISASCFSWVDPADIPPRQFVYGRHLIRQFMSTTAGATGLGKSSLGIIEGLAIASGKPLLGITPAERGKVWLFNGEDPKEELQRRIMAAALHYGLHASDFEGRLFVDSGRAMPIIIAQQTRDGARIETPVVDAVTATIEENKIDVVIIDPFVSTHRVTENDNNAIEFVAKTWARVADETNCAVELVHHIKKTGGAAATVEDSRGAIALINAARSARVLNSMTEEEAGRAGVENRRLFFRVDNGKVNVAPPAEKSDWFKLVSVDLANGDNVGVVTSWSWPDPFAEITAADLLAAQRAVADGRWRENAQARDWVGIPIAKALGRDLNNPKDKSTVKTLLKTWMSNGMFVTVEGQDETRQKRTFVEVGTWATD